MRGRVLRLAFAVLEAALAAALAVTLVGCASSTSQKPAEKPATAEPIKIGVIVSKTGLNAGLGVPEAQTIEMEAKRINDAGGINGRQVEVIIEDDMTDEAKAVAAASKLIEQDKVVAIIGASGTGTTMAVRGDVDRAGIPEVALSAGSVVTSPIDKLVFATPWSNALVMPYLCKYLQAQGITKIAVMSDTGGFGKDGLAVLQAEAPKYGIEIVTSQTFNPGDTDFAPQLTNIKKSDAKAMVVINAGKDAAAVVKQANEIGLGIPMYGTHGNARMDFITGAGAGAEGFKFPAGKILVPETYGVGTEEYKVATDFTDRFTAATGGPPNTFAGHAYDAFNMVAEAAARAGADLTPQTLRDQLEQTKGFVGIGGTFNYSATDHNGMTESDLVMYEIKDGKWVVVSK